MSEPSFGERIVLGLAVFILFVVVALGTTTTQCYQQARNGYERASQENHQYCADNGVMLEARILYRGLHRYREDINAFATTILALFTVVLAIATIFLWKSSEKHAIHMEGSVKAAQRASAAAQLTAETAASADAPLVLVERWSASFARSVYAGEPNYIRASVTLENFGRSPAFATFQCLDIKQTYVLPELPDYSNGFDIPYGQIIIRHERGYNFNDAILPDVNTELQEDIENDKVWVWIYGLIVYFDHLGTEWRYGFCARWFPRSTRRVNDTFSMIGPSSYTYRAYRRKGEDHYTEVAPRSGV